MPCDPSRWLLTAYVLHGADYVVSVEEVAYIKTAQALACDYLLTI